MGMFRNYQTAYAEIRLQHIANGYWTGTLYTWKGQDVAPITISLRKMTDGWCANASVMGAGYTYADGVTMHNALHNLTDYLNFEHLAGRISEPLWPRAITKKG